MRDRFFLFLYGRRNLVASGLALAGLGLLFAGVIKHYWAFIVAGLYALGYLLTPPERQTLFSANGFDPERIEDALDQLLRTIHKRVPGEVLGKVVNLRAAILALLPGLAELQDLTHSHNLHVVRETALVYLPEMLGSYLRLPAAFANLHPVKEGKTARQVLIEQLDLLDTELQKIAIDLHRQDANALLAHGRFLKEKFGHGEWDLG